MPSMRGRLQTFTGKQLLFAVIVAIALTLILKQFGFLQNLPVVLK